MSEMLPVAVASCEVPLPGGVLVLAPLRRFGLAAPEAARAGSTLQLLSGHPEAFARLRRDWVGLGLGGDSYRLSQQQMMSALEAAVAAGRLGAAFFPAVLNPVATLLTDSSQRNLLPGPPPTPAPAAVRDMSRDQRIAAMLKLVPNHLTGALKEAFLQMITPTAIGIMVGSLVVLLVGQAFGYGEVVDVALAAFAYTLAGLAGVAALYHMAAAVWDASKAQSYAVLDLAANRFAAALSVLGMTILLFLVARFRSRTRSRPAPKQEPEPQPQPQTEPPSNRTASPNKVGAVGEAAVRSENDIGPKVGIEVNGRARIPDGLTDTTLSEVKNVSKLSYTQQLRDFSNYANSTGRDFDLYVRPNTELSGPLLDAIQNGDINLKYIPTH